jgi:hypothetical protein
VNDTALTGPPLAKRATEMGAKRTLRALLKLHGDALVGWLLGNGTAL